MMPITTDTEETRYAAMDWSLLLRLLRYTLPHRRLLLPALLLLPLAALIQFGQPMVLQYAVDHHFVTGNMNGFGGLLALFLLLIGLQFVIGYSQSLLNAVLGQKVIHDLRADLFAHLLSLEAAFFDRHASGRLTNRLSNDSEAISQMIGAGLINLIGDLLLLIAIVIGMLLLSPPLTLIIALTMPLLIVSTLLIARRMRLSQRDGRLLQSRMANLLTEEIDGRDVVQLCQRQSHNIAEFDQLNRGYLNAAVVSNFYEALQVSLVEAISVTMVVLLFWYGATLMDDPGAMASGGVTVGILVAFIDYIRRLFMPIRDLSGKFTTMQAAMTALERIFELLDTPATFGDGPQTRPELSSRVRHGAITLRGVYFGYGQDPVLHAIDLDIRAGERVALVGATGAGKSTLIALLNRNYEVSQGEITIDGVDIRALPLQRLRRLIGVVQQETFLFSGTIADNISLYDPAIAPQRIRWALEQVGAMSFINTLADGIHTQLTERGNNLSSGQRQLLGIARAFAFDPLILVMDEATSSVDSASERLIQQAIDRLLQQRTALIIAHRLSTILDADRIVVLSRGRIAEQGQHEALIQQNGLYAQLFRLQFGQDS
ncbi:MAG: ABC transporter ATP-binding protein [Magnetococcales bacterium]|nr:ABC transporter ATP-binding protein [Magnetococcales bacterium]